MNMFVHLNIFVSPNIFVGPNTFGCHIFTKLIFEYISTPEIA